MKLLTRNRAVETLTVSQAAEYLGIARQNVQKLIEKGTLKATRDAVPGRRGFRYLVSRKDVKRVKKERG